MAELHHTAKPTELPERYANTHKPPPRTFHDKNHQVEVALLRQELALQDEPNETLQDISERADWGWPISSVWCALLVWRVKLKMLSFDFRQPKQAKRRVPSVVGRLVMRGHLLWIWTLLARSLCRLRAAYIGRCSLDRGAKRSRPYGSTLRAKEVEPGVELWLPGGGVCRVPGPAIG